MTNEQVFDVLVVGCGPTGATVATLLAKRGFTVAIADQFAEIYDKPRASSADHEAMRIFQECGIADEVARDISPHVGADYYGLEAQVIKRFYPQPAPFPLGWEPTFMFVQPKLEKVLRDAASENGVHSFLGKRLESFTENSLGVSAQLVDDASKTHTDVRAKYLLGCDGGRSFVRRSLSIGLEDFGFDEWWVVVDAWLEGPAELPPRCAQFCNPARPASYIVGHGNLRRWEIKLLPGESPDDFQTLESVQHLLSQVLDISPLKLWRTAAYEFHAVVSKSWRKGRVFLLGDAAHQMPPFLAQGMCAGIRDASNLAWKLEAVERLGCSSALLDTYQVERKPHVSTIIRHAKEFGKIIGELDFAAAKLRDQRLESELKAGTAQTIRQRFIPNLEAGLIAQGADGQRGRGAGHILVQPEVQDITGHNQRLDDVVPRGFLLLAATDEPLSWLDNAAQAFWTQIDGASAVVAAESSEAKPGVFREKGVLFADMLQSFEAQIVIVRPDKYLFGTAADRAELNALLRQLASQLGA